jgi:Family of unknown function (DUF6161)
MTKNEFKKLVAQSPNAEQLSKFKIEFNFSKIGGEKSFKSIVDFFDFIFDQTKEWAKYPNLNNEISKVKAFEDMKHFLETQILEFFNVQQDENATNTWRQYNLRNLLNAVITTCSDITDTRCILMGKISDEYGDAASLGAFRYFLGTHQMSSFTNDQFKGYLLAYEFEASEKSKLFSRIKFESKGLDRLYERVNNFTTELNTQHIEHLKQTTDYLNSHFDDAEKYQKRVDEVYNSWFKKSKTDFQSFESTANQKINDLEDIYQKKLQLKAPAEYWDKKSKEYLDQGILMKNIITWIVAIFGGFLAAILVISPEWIFKSAFDSNKMPIIRWSILFITLVSLIAFVIRALTKVMFSSYHLARDAEERHTLTFFYLALLQDPKSIINDEDRKMIIQSLFSRTDTGLLKGDASPEMPGDLISKIVGKG